MSPSVSHSPPLFRPDLATLEAARSAIAGTIRSTPITPSADLSHRLGVPVLLKMEHHQVTGSFKLRGAANAVAGLSQADKDKGVVAVSTGNHGRALAHAAKAAGVRCIVCMSNLVPANKVESIRALGAETRIIGKSQDDAQEEVDRLVAAEGMTLLPPFDHPAIIAGQGTLGLDLLDQAPEVETVLVPLSGGGLIAGVAAAVKAVKPGIRVIGISMDRGAAMVESQRAGRPVQVEEVASLADSLGGGIGLDNRYTFPLVRDLVDDLITLTEVEIADGMRHAYWRERQVVEGAAAVGLGALIAGKVEIHGPVAVILSGGNVDMAQHFRVMGGGEA
ncbi:MAG: hydroxyectoine utilization dehydratase EutB [Rhodospirillum sp.]|nr:hydroxyectoine utilization dehydratase EutB [Rhodospirillum sp.]MCF8490191.1 hydroxyectoine utilization dehydratase EutB [Rhodospirillum sp.]MCF8500351.1 hydroxyectoine utilization dehydratase EutB [Rhodospirillum sp.]